MAELTSGTVLILRVLRAACLVCAAVVVLIVAIEAWKTWFVAAERQFVPGDYVFFAVLAGLLVGLLWLVRSISRELRRSQGS